MGLKDLLGLGGKNEPNRIDVPGSVDRNDPSVVHPPTVITWGSHKDDAGATHTHHRTWDADTGQQRTNVRSETSRQGGTNSHHVIDQTKPKGSDERYKGSWSGSGNKYTNDTKKGKRR